MFSRTRKILIAGILLLLTGCSTSGTDSGGAPAVVTVTDYSGVAMPNATVVMGDSNGAMKAYGTTNTAGQITFANAPANATITAANTCLRSGSTTTTYFINIKYDVNGSVVLPLDNCTGIYVNLPILSFPTGSDSPLGTMTVNVTNIPSNVTKNQINVGRGMYASIGGLITKQTITINESDLDKDGTFSILVKGFDSARNFIAYGFLADQTLTDGMIVNINMEPVSFVQYQITNIPDTAVKIQPALKLGRTGKQTNFGSAYSYSLSSVPSSTTIAMAYIPGYGNDLSYQLDIGLDQDHNGIADSTQSLRLNSSAASPSGQIFDLSKALSAPFAIVSNADTATPTFSWSGIDSASTTINIGPYMSNPTRQFYVSFNDAISSRTRVTYPELPDVLAAFRPEKVDSFFVHTHAFEGEIEKYSYGYYHPTF